MLTDEDVREFVGALPDAGFVRSSMSRDPATHGPFAMPDYYFEFRRAQAAALEAAADVVAEVADDFARLTGRINHTNRAVRLDDAGR